MRDNYFNTILILLGAVLGLMLAMMVDSWAGAIDEAKLATKAFNECDQAYKSLTNKNND